MRVGRFSGYRRGELDAIEREVRKARAAAEARCPQAAAAARSLEVALAETPGGPGDEPWASLYRAWAACQDAVDRGVDLQGARP